MTALALLETPPVGHGSTRLEEPVVDFRAWLPSPPSLQKPHSTVDRCPGLRGATFLDLSAPRLSCADDTVEGRHGDGPDAGRRLQRRPP